MPLGTLIQGESILDGKRRIDPWTEYNEYIVKEQRNTIVRYLVRFQ